MFQKRLQYGLIHLALSLALTLVFLAIIFKVWYPSIMAQVFGIRVVVLIFVVVNVVLWPFFSALIYKLDKAELKRDLTIMTTLQVVLSGMMLFYLYQVHPVWIAFTDDFFDITRRGDVQQDKYPLKIAVPMGILTPYGIYGASFSSDPYRRIAENNDDIFGKRIHFFPSALVKIGDKKADLQKKAQPVANLKQFNPAEKVAAVLQQYPNATKFIPLVGFAHDASVLTNDDLTWFVPVDLQPWPNDAPAEKTAKKTSK